MNKLLLLVSLSVCLLLFKHGDSNASHSGKDTLYTQTEVWIDSAAQSVFGTLAIPNIKEKMPLVLIVPGSGATDRNGNNIAGLSTDCYRLLAEGLAAEKIASLRYDKRGVAKSTPALESETMLSTGLYVDDVEKWIKWLRKSDRFSKIIVMGHSEGALIGTLAANFQRPDGFITIAGAGMRADSLIIDQISKQSKPLADTARKIISQINKDEPFFVNRDLAALFRPSVIRYLKSWFSLSPVVEISLVRCPVLVIQGSHDIQVSVGEAKALAAAKSGFRLAVIDNMNHVLKDAPGNMQENLATYKNPALPLSPGLIPAITGFIKELK